jgi:hypothetical protein
VIVDRMVDIVDGSLPNEGRGSSPMGMSIEAIIALKGSRDRKFSLEGSGKLFNFKSLTIEGGAVTGTKGLCSTPATTTR